MALSHLVVQYESNFCTVALQFMEEEKNYPLPSPAATGTAPLHTQPERPACPPPRDPQQTAAPLEWPPDSRPPRPDTG